MTPIKYWWRDLNLLQTSEISEKFKQRVSLEFIKERTKEMCSKVVHANLFVEKL